jgi:hypothetical protein
VNIYSLGLNALYGLTVTYLHPLGQILPIKVTSKGRLSDVVGNRDHIGETEARGRTDRGFGSKRSDTNINFGHML